MSRDRPTHSRGVGGGGAAGRWAAGSACNVGPGSWQPSESVALRRDKCPPPRGAWGQPARCARRPGPSARVWETTVTTSKAADVEMMKITEPSFHNARWRRLHLSLAEG